MRALRQFSGARAVGALGLSTRRDTSPAVNRKRQYDSEADYWNEVCRGDVNSIGHSAHYQRRNCATEERHDLERRRFTCA